MCTWQRLIEANTQIQGFVSHHAKRTVFQSSHWQKVLSSIQGVREVFWAVGKKNDETIGCALVTVYALPGNMCWLHVGGGPLFAEGYQEDGLRTWTDWIAQYARSVGAVWTRIEPAYDDQILTELLPSAWKKSSVSYQPEASLWLDLQQTEENILAQMKQKGRYNIRLAQKKGVYVCGWQYASGSYVQVLGTEVTDVVPLEEFYRMFQETTTRDGFSGRAQAYYEKVMEALGDNGLLLLAFHEGDVLAGAICSMQNGVGVYIFGASTSMKRSLMAPYAIQWAAIQEAKKRGMTAYDFLGISPPNIPDHPWKHVTEFKTKFGGEVRVYLGAWTRVHRPFMYMVLQMLKWVRKHSRR